MTCIWSSQGMDWRLKGREVDEVQGNCGRIQCDPCDEPRALATQLRAELDKLRRESRVSSDHGWRVHWAWSGGSNGLRDLIRALPARWQPLRVCGPGPELLLQEILPDHPELSAQDGICFVWNGDVHAVVSGKGEVLHRSRPVADQPVPDSAMAQAWLRQTAALWKCKTGLPVGNWWNLNELQLLDSVDELLHRALAQPVKSTDRHQADLERIRTEEVQLRCQSHLKRGLVMVLAAVAISALAACRSSDDSGGGPVTQGKWNGMKREIQSYDANRSEQLLQDELSYAASFAMPELFRTLPAGLKLKSAAYRTGTAADGLKPRGVWRIQGIAMSKEQMPTLENWTETISLRPGVGEVTAVNISQMENLIQFKIETEVRP